VYFEPVLSSIMDIIGSRRFQPQVGCQFKQASVKKPAARQEIVLQFNKEIVPAEYFGKPDSRFFSPVVFTPEN